MESLGTSPKRNDGGDGRPWGVAAQSWATAPATLTEKRAMKKEEDEAHFAQNLRTLPASAAKIDWKQQMNKNKFQIKKEKSFELIQIKSFIILAVIRQSV